MKPYPLCILRAKTVYFHGGNESIFSVTNRASFLSFEMALSPPMRILTGPNIVEKSSLFRRVLVLLEDCYSQIPARLRRSILSGIPASDLWFPLRTEAKCMKSALTPVFGAVTTHRLNQVAIKHFMQMYTKRNPSYLMGSTIPAVHSWIWGSEAPGVVILPVANLWGLVCSKYRVSAALLFVTLWVKEIVRNKSYLKKTLIVILSTNEGNRSLWIHAVGHEIHIIYEELKNGHSKKNGPTNLELIRSQCM